MKSIDNKNSVFCCYHCNTSTTLNLTFEAFFYACPNCGTIYSKNLNNDYVFKERLGEKNYENSFSIGQIAHFYDEPYTVISFLIKSNSSQSRWIEYVLQNENGEFLYLSESSGNFILLEQIEYEKKVGNHPNQIDYQGKTYDRYDYSSPKLDFASGYFDFNIIKRHELIEYILPPFIMSFEKFEQNQTAFFGKHISRKKIKKAFNTNQIPSKTSVGTIQPFIINFRNLVLTFSFIAILILLTHWYLNNERTEQEVLNTTIPFENYKSKDYISPTFELKGSSAPLQISVYSEVNNSWANVQVALINEKTNEEIYATKDIEYYHGYTEGENWTEGSTSEDFNICGVSSGKYHFTVTPIKAPEDLNNSHISIKATWNKPSLRNFFMTVLFMAIFSAIIYYLSKKFEEKRWSDY